MQKIAKAAAICMSGLLSLSSVPFVGTAAADDNVIYQTDFEDGDISAFTNRGGDDTTELSISTEAAVSGTSSLLASGRSADWNGPAFRLDDKCKPNTEYYISAQLKGRYYTGSMMSFQYTDADGTVHYSNLVQNLNGSDWIAVENVKVSFTADMTDVYVYFEGGQDDLFLDDFSVVEVPEVPIETDIPSLKEVYGSAFKVGTALTASDLSVKSFMNLVEKHCNQSVTVGNEMKPDSVLNQAACQAYVAETGDDTVPQISFSAAKPILEYCNKNKIPVRVHTLVWHSQTPDWFFKENYENDGEWVDSEKMLKRMENYIKIYFETLTELYPNIDFYACDVVNEAWLEDGNPRKPGEQGNSGSGNSAWVQVFGDNSFIEPAFTFARKYAPEGCKLYYNDYNEYMDGKMKAIVEMATALKEKGLIDGIGMQSHLDARQSLDSAFPSVSAYNKALDTYAALGLDIQITELDATVPENSGDQYFDVQAEYYSGIFDAILAHKENISAVIFWGIQDDRSWRAKQQPLLFDTNFQAKPAFYSIVEDVDLPPFTETKPVGGETTTEAEQTTTGAEQTTSDTVQTTTISTEIMPTEGLPGDVNCDGKLEMVDAVLLARLSTDDSTVEVTDTGRALADITKDQKLTSDDTVLLLQHLTGIAPLF